MLSEWNRTESEYPRDRCVHQLFELQVERTPSAIAVIEGWPSAARRSLTYQELNICSNQLAHYLRSLGVGPEVCVGVCLERSVELEIAGFGVLKAGGAYLPLDADYPSQRLNYMLQDAKVAVLITQKRLAKGLETGSMVVICLDTDWVVIAQESQVNPTCMATPENLAYVIYTSGSTGTPKGAMISRRSLCNVMCWAQRAYPLNEADRVLLNAPISFDTAWWEFYIALLAGATLVVAKPGGHLDPSYLIQTIIEEGVTIVDLVPSLLRVLMEHPRFKECTGLRWLFCGGEALTPDLVELVFANLKVNMGNLYGPAEATNVTLHHTLLHGQTCQIVPIGRPVSNTQAYILDNRLQILPMGEVGELFLGGDNVGRGYLYRPELTAERFLPDPFSGAGRRLYRTGDLARYLPNGDIEYLGRVDLQIKIRGMRVEPNEVESHLNQYPGVRRAAVQVQQRPGGERGSGTERLVAYLALHPGAHITAKELRAYLSVRLPAHMVPSVYIFLDDLPLSLSGKLDRQALAQQELRQPDLGKDYIAPRTPIEEALVGIWSQVLGIEQLGIEENFFELGGNSLALAQVLARAVERFQVELSILNVFETPDIAHMAQQVEQMTQAGQTLMLPPIQRGPRVGRLPLSFPQEQVWFLLALEPDNLAYNYQASLRFHGRLDLAALEKTMSEIVRRHEIYRTTFHEMEGAPFQVIHEPWVVKIPLVDLSNLPHDQQITEAGRLLASYYEEVFSIEKMPLIKWRLLKFSDEEHLLVHLEHHLVHDGLSFVVLMREIRTLYTGFIVGRTSSLDELPIQFADYAVWQRQTMQGEYLKQRLSYWKERLRDAPPLLSLPADRNRPSRKSFRGKSIQVDLGADLYNQTKEFSQREGITLFTTFLAAFKALLYRYTGQEDLVVGSGFANRRLHETEALIGMLVNTVVLRTDLSGNLTFRQLLGRVRRTILDAYINQDMPFEKLVKALQVERNLSYNPLFQVMFSFHDSPIPLLELPDLTVNLEYQQNKSAKFDLNVVVIPHAAQLRSSSASKSDRGIILVWEYDTDLFDADRMQRMVEHYLALLRQMVEAPDQKINQAQFLSQAERELLLKRWNTTRTEYPRQSSVSELFEIEARSSPQAIAVALVSAPGTSKNAPSLSPVSLTYRELNERANQLARYLQKLGVRRQTLVGVFMERTPDMVVALLGILKAGGVYAPLDLSFPRNRLQFMIDDMRLPVLVSQGKLAQSLPVVQAHIVCLDEDWLQIAQEPTGDLPVQNAAMDPAYVMYTSGSTGTSKGISIPHRAIVRLVKDTNYIQIERGDRIGQVSNMAFDAATFEIWGALLNGARLVMLPQEIVLSPAEYARMLRREKIQVVWVTAALFNQIASIEPAAFRSVRDVLTGGDIVSPMHMRQVLSAGGPQRLLNGYGPTENTTFTTWHQVNEIEDVNRSIPIGRPVANTQTYILDRWLNLLPVGIPGELYVGGDGLALGYLQRPELTAERFVPNPFGEPGQRMYRTGDLAKVLSDGSIEFLGRIDQQVKLRGFRVELGEIESALIEHPAVQQAVVALRESSSGEKFLAAYLVGQSERTASPVELRNFLRTRLPDFMLPSAFVFMTALPLTSNGKVDRRALPEPGTVGPASDRPVSEVATAFERVLMQIWIDVLGVEQIGLQDNFFDLGGHSLLVFRIMNRIEELFDLDLSLTILFGAPTFSDFAQTVLENLADKERIEEIARLLLKVEAVQGGENEAVSDDREDLNPGDRGSREE